MSDVSKEAAKALKGVGFKGDVNSYYKIKSDYDNGEKLRISDIVGDWNHGPWYSAPTHLQAGDWLFDKAKSMDITVIVQFYPDRTYLESNGGRLHVWNKQNSPHHRDLAIIEACKIIKERKTNPLP